MYLMLEEDKLSKPNKKYLRKIFPTIKSGEVEVIGFTKTNRGNEAVLKFLNTGNLTCIQPYKIKTKMIKDRSAPLLFNVANVGNVLTTGENNFYYRLWIDILKRCYDKTGNKDYISYKNVFVSDEWLTFENFLNDIKALKNHDAKLKYNKVKWHIDKDILSGDNKVYSKYTCCWIPREINFFFTNKRENNTSGFEGVRLNGKRYISEISEKGKVKNLGRFKTKIEAYEAYTTEKELILKRLLSEYYFIDEDIKMACIDKLKEQTKETKDKNLN